MVQSAGFLRILLVILPLVSMAQLAHAGCAFTGIGSTANPSTLNIGSYTSATVPGSTSISVTFSLAAQGSGSGSCTGGIILRRATAPAQLTMPGTSTVLPYSATLGGLPLTFGAVPATAPSLGDFATTANVNVQTSNTATVYVPVTVTFAVTPGPVPSPPPSGLYSDALIVDVFDVQGQRFVYNGSFNLTVVANVVQACTISNPVNTSQIIYVGPTGLNSGAQLSAPSFNVVCGGASTVTLSSQNGGVTLGDVPKASLVPITSFRNNIDYTASITGNSSPVTLNTAASSVMTGVFSTSAVNIAGVQVLITPETSGVPLVSGNYRDVLTVSILPQ